MRFKSLSIVLFLILSVVPVLGFLHPGLPITDDGQDQVARISSFYQNLQAGVLIPRWAENLNWGYGHPILMFLYPLPSYIASFFHVLGFSLVDSTKLVFVVSFVLSGVCMYLWLSSFLSSQAALCGAVIYQFAPYRFVDMYVRGDIGECLAFIFPPLIFYFLYKLYRKYTMTSFVGLSFATAGLILAHNAMALMFMPFVIIYMLYLLWQKKWDKKYCYVSTVFLLVGFGLAAFFWVPGLLEGKYTLRSIVIKGDIESNFVSLQRLIYGSWQYGIGSQFTLQVGILQWLAAISSLLALFFLRRKQKEFVFIASTLVCFILSIFMMTKSSQPIWEHISILQNFQFPWRFLSVSIFLSSVLGAATFSLLPKKTLNWVLILILFTAFVLNVSDFHAQGYSNKKDSFYSAVYAGTTDTGESAPVWSVRFMEQPPDALMDVISGRAKIFPLLRTPVYHQYKIVAGSRVQLRENTLYFPGWNIFVDGIAVPIQYQDPNNRGIMTFFAGPGTHTIDVRFSDTRLRYVSDYTSFISLLLLIVLLIYRKNLWLS